MARSVAIGLVLAVLLLAAELLAPTLAVRAMERSLGPCLAAERLEITRLSRPVLPQVLLGRVRDAEVVATGISLPELRVEEVVLDVEEVSLPWRVTSPDQPPVTVTATVTAADAQASLRETLPLGLTPSLRFDDGEIAIGLPGISLEARFVPVVDPDRVALIPAVGPPEWWEALGLSLGVDLPVGVSVRRVDVDQDRVEAWATVDLDELELEEGDGPGCVPAAGGSPAGPVAVGPAGPVAVGPAGPVAVGPAGPVAVGPAGPVAVGGPAGPVAVAGVPTDGTHPAAGAVP